MFVLRYGIPVKVPSPAMVPQGDRSLGELRRLWDENQEWLRAYIGRLDRQGFRRAVFEHPVAGPLNVEQAVHMDQVHLDTHVRQIQEASAPAELTHLSPRFRRCREPSAASNQVLPNRA